MRRTHTRTDDKFLPVGKIKFAVAHLRGSSVCGTESGGDERRIERRLASSDLINRGNDAERDVHFVL